MLVRPVKEENRWRFFIMSKNLCTACEGVHYYMNAFMDSYRDCENRGEE